MDYFAWRRKLKVWVSIFLLIVCDLSLLLLNEIAMQAENDMRVEIQYPLREIPESQAVMCVDVVLASKGWSIVANKEGRWKIFENSVEYYEEFEEKYGEDWSAAVLCDYILVDDRIPWQPERILIDKRVLERALNIQKVKFTPIRMKYIPEIYEGISWCFIDASPKRETLYCGKTTPVRYGLTMSYMQNRFRQLEEMGNQVCHFPVLHDGYGDFQSIK